MNNQEYYEQSMEAYEAMKALNERAGRREFGVHQTVDGWTVCRRMAADFNPPYIQFKNWLRQQIDGHSNALVQR